MIRFLIMKSWNYCESVAFAALRSSKALERAMDFELRKYGEVTAAQSRVLGCLFFYKNGITQKEIADRLGIEAATVVPIIDRLEELSHVERKPDPADRRNNLVFFTKQGQDTWSEIVKCASRVRKAAEKGIDGQELVLTYRVLTDITGNLARHLESASASKPSIPETVPVRKASSPVSKRRSYG